MCGRTACTLCKSDILHATKQYSPGGKLPNWIEKYSWQTYRPCYNIGPTQVTPVLVKEKLVNLDADRDKIAVFPMKWGLIPSWYKGNEEDFSLYTFNCRSETVLEKPTFRKAVTSGQRCVILADGFFEWKHDGRTKVPYFIYFPNDKGVTMENRTWKDENYATDNEDWSGPRLLTMAGIFDIWKSSEVDDMYSYSVVTTDSSKTVAHIHNRMPAILDGAEEVHMWLDSGRISSKEAIENLKAVENLNMYQVHTVVNRIKNNVVECVLPLSSKKSSESKMDHQPKITSWFRESASASGPVPKKVKFTDDSST